jgi:hypothetical protein
MNERVPDSTGLPLRAMVMVLLFLGVIFLLVGFQAMGSGSSSDDDSSLSTVTTSKMAPKTSAKPAPPKSEVRVYNVSGTDGLATRTRNQLKDGGYDVPEIGDMPLSKVSKTTVYFTDAPGEKETADAVGQLLKAPVVARIPEIADKPPGVIVLAVG